MFRTILLSSVVALSAAGAAQAQTAPGRWTVSLEAGAEFPTGGDVHGGATAPVPDLGPLNPALAGVNAELRIQSRSFGEERPAVQGTGEDAWRQNRRGEFALYE